MSANDMPTLATESGTQALNQGLDMMVKVHKDYAGRIMNAADDQALAQTMFSPNEIAALLTLAVRRLAELS